MAKKEIGDYQEKQEENNIKILPLSSITPDPDQPRKYFDEDVTNRLAKSIKRHGLLQPILVRPIEDPVFDYMIVLGEMRFRAHEKLDCKSIKAIVHRISREEAEDLQLIENIQRQDLSDIELAWEFKRRVDSGQTHETIARLLEKSRTYVSQRLARAKSHKLPARFSRP